jgi:hypothetical protein
MVKDPKWQVLKILPTDYLDHGGKIERWKLIELDYPDCSYGCKWWAPLYNKTYDGVDGDWGVCTNPSGPRAGLLTWEHQAGFNCFKTEKKKK